jgi:hypothetical protein
MPRPESSLAMILDRRVFLIACLAAAPPLRADPATVVVEGQRFERHARVAGSDLVLNGTGVRAVAWFKGYAAALYLAAPARSPAQALAMAGPKRLQMRLLRQVPAAEFVKALKHGVERNAAPDELPRLAERLLAFEALIAALGSVREGDVVDLDLDPAQGMLFSLNGTLQGEAIAGGDFFAAVLRAFIGERPYDARLKAGLLGRPG